MQRNNEIGVLVRDRHELPHNTRFCPQLFRKFADERLFGCFPCFDLAARKLIFVCDVSIFAFAALCRQHAAFFEHDRADDL